MSEPENFLERWSRRKHAATATAPAPDKPQDMENAPPSASAPPRGDPNDPPSAEPSFDLASLPSIESIGAESDVRAFLQPGVPPELTRAALRRAWSSDPAIRDFVGLVENGWDFNDPEGVPGFGPISPADAGQLLSQLIGTLPPEGSAHAAEPAANANSAAPGETEPQLPSPQEQPAEANDTPDVHCSEDAALRGKARN